MSFAIRPLSISGLFTLLPEAFRDSRGCFLETWAERDFLAAGLDLRFVQDNQSMSRKGVLRGLHYQKSHPQGKLVRVISGEIFDVAVDLRTESPTFGLWEGVFLTGEKQNQLYVPPGFANGFLALSDDTVVIYKCTDYYHPEDEYGIRWDDPRIGIAWPDLGMAPFLSVKDQSLPGFDPTRACFKADGSSL
ncbi:MAG: dTDP-4-dehydrorhamnose 3,5-epimerase [Spirochaetae bacterium HGW-Spirochaetae-7]|nr:MAG: dTDP-4-dehydrorhamnose 3,5-epimerase [Spirochaetae bacterium HGW-Spirochaetae-7]